MTNSWLTRAVALLSGVSFLLGNSGCATMIRGQHQMVTLRTQPPGGKLIYQGVEISDGDTITVQKRYDAPHFHSSDPNAHVMWDMHYEADPLLIADAALLLVFIVPGLVALGVDFGTGAWRDLDDPQVIYVPDSVADSAQP